MELNDRLKSLYASKWKDICHALQAVKESEQNATKPSYPFLLSLTRWENDEPDESWYADAGLKVMVFGQETNSWFGACDDFGTPPSPVFNPDVAMEAVMGIYENFYATYYQPSGFSYNGARYGTFHYGLNRFMSLLNTRFPDQSIAYLWNNIVKIGRAKSVGFCGKDIYEVQKLHFRVIEEEIDILKPDLILFLTGNYDNHIQDYWNDVKFTALSPFAVNEAASVSLPGVKIPAYRTNHPSARLPKEEKEARLEAIVNDFINDREK